MDLSRRRFVAGLLPMLVSVAAAKDALAQASRAEVMESGHVPNRSSRGGLKIGDLVADGDGRRSLLIPPPARPHQPGRVREFELVAVDRRVDLARGVTFDSFAYNGTVPGPILRVTHDDVLTVMFTNNSSHPHTIHFHGTHPARMDGSVEIVKPGSSFVYEMKARPYGMHLYHCHARPLASHIGRGLYGALIVDPAEPRRPAQELVLVMSGFDTDGDGRNDVYAFNGRPFLYEARPIRVRRAQPVRVYLANLTEHDPVVSFHLHGEFFRLYRTGTTDSFEYTDTVTLGQGERCIVEIDFENRGLFMFHAHQSRLADNGLSGWFDVVDGDEPALAATGVVGRYADQFADCAPCLDELGAKAMTKY
jgi:manganese oxidase